MGMKKFVSFVAAMAIMTSGASALATDVNAAAYNYNYTTARVSTTKVSSTKRTGKQLTYKQAYNRLKDLGFVGGTTQNNKPANNTQTTKPSNATQNNNKPTTSTKPNQNTQQNTKGAVYMTDHKGNAISTSSLVFRGTLTRNQQYLYDTIKDAVAKGLTSVTFNNYYSRNDIIMAYTGVKYDNPYLVWFDSYNWGTSNKQGFNSIKLIYDSTLVKDRAGALQLMDDYLKPMLDKASKMSTDIDKVKFVHDWIIYNVNDGSKKSNVNSSNGYYHVAYAAVVDKMGVCAAYTNAFTYCMQKLGIPCTMLAGTTWSGGGHCWNLVKVGGDWYECDVYWDDVLTKAETDYTYTCFMQTTTSLKAYDTYNGKSRTRYVDCECLPLAKGTKYSPDNYRYSNGSNFRDLAKVVITQRTNTSTVRGYVASAGYTQYNNTITAKPSTTKSSLPSGWYKYKAINILGKKTISESDWTKDGKFYYIEKTNNGKSTGNYYIYDTAYDNYYYADSSLSSISWYNYKTGVWTRLE